MSLNIICWYIILTLSLSELLKQNIKYKILNSAFLLGLLVSQLFNFFSEDYQNSNLLKIAFIILTFVNLQKHTNHLINFIKLKSLKKLINMWIKITLFAVLDFNPK